ncbi:hypothetical protein LZ30DRAFT_774243 [Colletotrichum cereale]|nr:hypothetical protein LZ30DRAFT_774243 [Colletotrichum cereale]
MYTAHPGDIDPKKTPTVFAWQSGTVARREAVQAMTLSIAVEGFVSTPIMIPVEKLVRISSVKMLGESLMQYPRKCSSARTKCIRSVNNRGGNKERRREGAGWASQMQTTKQCDGIGHLNDINPWPLIGYTASPPLYQPEGTATRPCSQQRFHRGDWFAFVAIGWSISYVVAGLDTLRVLRLSPVMRGACKAEPGIVEIWS